MEGTILLEVHRSGEGDRWLNFGEKFTLAVKDEVNIYLYDENKEVRGTASRSFMEVMEEGLARLQVLNEGLSRSFWQGCVTLLDGAIRTCLPLVVVDSRK